MSTGGGHNHSPHVLVYYKNISVQLSQKHSGFSGMFRQIQPSSIGPIFLELNLRALSLSPHCSSPMKLSGEMHCGHFCIKEYYNFGRCILV